MKSVQSLRDKARELVSIAEGEIQKREITIVTLKRELEKVKGELAAIKDQQRAVRSPKCDGCTYKVIALKALDEEETMKAK